MTHANNVMCEITIMTKIFFKWTSFAVASSSILRADSSGGGGSFVATSGGGDACGGKAGCEGDLGHQILTFSSYHISAYSYVYMKITYNIQVFIDKIMSVKKIRLKELLDRS